MSKYTENLNDNYTISLPVIDRCLIPYHRTEVTKHSDDELRDALERFARYFKGEFHYDRVQYKAVEHKYYYEEKEVEYRGFLFTNSAHDVMTEDHESMPTRLIGGCCFRHKEYSDGWHWFLDWIWLHPFFRNKRILHKNWEYFQQEFGKFYPEPPLSPAMKHFWNKHEPSRPID